MKDILYTAEKKLIDREVHTFNFYLDNAQYASAENRLKELNKFVPEHEELPARILYLRAKLDLQQNNVDQAHEHLKTLVTSFPQSQFTDMTQQLIANNEKGVVERFLF